EDEQDGPEIEFATVDRPGPPARGGRLVTVLVLAAIAGGVWFFARTKKAPTPSPGPADTAESAAPAPAAPGPGSIEQPAAASAPAPRSPTASPAPPAAPAPPAIPESRGSSIVTPDWTGRSPVWMIHFSSYQRKENADRDAARLAKLLGRPLRVVEVNLGAQGVWYRVMLGEYPSRESAQSERDALAGKGTPGIGFVYRVEGLPPSRVESVSPPRADAP
ncbi:MAG TPA: SPOR domain-containing protein, partial [Thermoanaerobaculia bacterium]|nr:SPOR domain-containing protein [Thermoanaerobaculia bacterium]